MARNAGTEGTNQPHMAAAGESQKQSVSAEPEQKRETPEQADGIQHFDTTIAKVKTLDDGEEIEVMSDHLMPGETLKRASDEEKAEQKAKASRKAANKAAEERK